MGRSGQAGGAATLSAAGEEHCRARTEEGAAQVNVRTGSGLQPEPLPWPGRDEPSVRQVSSVLPSSPVFQALRWGLGSTSPVLRQVLAAAACPS